jgi:biopolymer transport protein ExbD
MRQFNYACKFCAIKKVMRLTININPMAQIENNNHGKNRFLTGRTLLRVDLTPMVDLGFLLISFFMLSTTFSQPRVANLIMPKDSDVETPVGELATLTLMPVRNNEISYYEGRQSQPALIQHCSYAEVRAVIRQKRQKVAEVLGSADKTVIIIDPGPESSYKNFMDILDEIQINDIQHYFVISHR